MVSIKGVLYRAYTAELCYVRACLCIRARVPHQVAKAVHVDTTVEVILLPVRF